MSQPQKKQLWQVIIQQKIRNPGICANSILSCKRSKMLYAMANQVKSGDKDNIEAQAALLYFQTAFGKDFRRRQENRINAHLNYAYTVLRSAVARALVQYGWLPTWWGCFIIMNKIHSILLMILLNLFVR